MKTHENRIIINEGINHLNNILRNLNKAPNRKYRKITLEQKLINAKLTYGKVTDALAIIETEIKESELFFLTNAIRQVYSNVHILILSKLERAAIHKISLFTLSYAILFINKLLNKIKSKMAKVNIKTGATLINMYDGNPKNLDAFLDSVALFVDIVNNENAAASQAAKDAAKATTLRFIKTRLTETARQSIPENANLDQLIDALKTNCSSKTTAENVLAKLKNTKQTSSTEDFCTEVEKLTQELKSIYIRNRIPGDVALQMATKCGVDALIAGTKNSETKTILRAGTFTRLNDAIQKLQENDAVQKAQEDKHKNANAMQAQVFMANRNQYNRGRGRSSSFNYQRGNRNPHNRLGRNWQNSNQSFYHNNQPRFQNQRSEWNTRGHGNPRGHYSQRGRPTIYFMQPGLQATNQHSQQQALALPMQQHQQNQQIPMVNSQNFTGSQQIMPNPNFLGAQFGQHAR